MSARLGLWAVMAFWILAPALAAEDITLTTYYPSPRGVYAELRTTNDTFLSTQAGSVLVGTTATPATNPKFYVLGTFEATTLRASQPSSAVALFLEGTPGLDDAWADMGAYNYQNNSYGAMHIDAVPLVLNRLSMGNVGIGFNSPVAKLHVHQIAAAPVFRADSTSCDKTPFLIDDMGRVGIGTDVPIAPLEVANIDGRETLIFLNGSTTADSTRVRISNRNTGGRHYSLVSTGGGSPHGQGKFVISDQAANGMSDTARLVIDNTGDVGIGTSSPESRLHISGGSITIQDGNEGNGKVLKSDGSGHATWQTNYAVYAP